MKSLKCCYFPTTIVCIDDDSWMLKSLKANIDISKMSFVGFQKPQEAITYLNTESKKDILFDRTSQGQLDYTSVYSLYEEIYNPDRFRQISCVIVDYDMPGMNGLELCSRITNPHLKKIMLTGAADESLAIEAFNKGLIDYFIRKNDPKTFDRLEGFIEEANIKYFESISKSFIDFILKGWVAHNPKDATILDEKFRTYFDEFIKNLNILEYYLLDVSGSYLLINSSGKISALYSFNEETLGLAIGEFEGYFKTATALQKAKLKKVFEDIKAKKQALCLPHTGVSELNLDNLAEYVYPIYKIQDSDQYFVAYVPEINYLNRSEILNFADYIAQ